MDAHPIPAPYVHAISLEKARQTPVSPRALWHQPCAAMLHRGVSVKTKRHTTQTAQVGLCRRALPWRYALVSASYRLRCHLECHVQDANQDGGLDDGMQGNARPVYPGAHRAMGMGKGSQAWGRPMRAPGSAGSVQDLTAWCRGQQYVIATVQGLPEPPEPICLAQVVAPMAELGRVNHAVNPA